MEYSTDRVEDPQELRCSADEEGQGMTMGESDSIWAKKGATLSDKSAREEFGLTQEEIIEAIKAGKLQYRHNNMYGNPYFKLIRSEVEALVDEKYGEDYLNRKRTKKELAEINSQLRKLKTQIVSLEKRKAQLMSDTAEKEDA
jgi:hypothetical protein